MQITGLNIENYGVCKEQSFDDIQSSILVIFGPNEAGKTTTMQFIRGLFFGLNSSERRAYTTGSATAYGGALKAVDSEGNNWTIKRMLGAEEDTSIFINGQVFPASVLGRDLLSGIGPELFEHVFTVGLSELQHLNQLNATDAAEFLYEMTSGFDRKSVGETLKFITDQRLQLLSDSGLGQIQELHGQLNNISNHLETRQHEMQSWVATSNEIEINKREIDSLQASLTNKQSLLKHLDVYASIHSDLIERDRLRASLKDHEPPKILRKHTSHTDRSTILELASNGQSTLLSIDEREVELLRLEEELRTIKQALLPLDIVPRMSAFAEMLPWVTSLLTGIELLADKPTKASDGNPFTVNSEFASTSQKLDKRLLLKLRQPVRKLKESRKRLAEFERLILELQQNIAETETTWVNLPSWRSLSITPSLEHPSTELRQTLSTLVRTQKDLANTARPPQAQNGNNPATGSWDYQSRLESPASLLLNATLISIGGTLLGMGLFFPEAFGLSAIATAICTFGGFLSTAGGVYGTILQTRQKKHIALRKRRRAELKQLRQQTANRASDSSQQTLEYEDVDVELVELEAAIKNTESLLDMAHEIVKLRLNQTVIQRQYETELIRHQDALTEWQGSLSELGLPISLSPRELYTLVDNADSMAAQQRVNDRHSADLQRKQGELRELDLRMINLLDDAGISCSQLTVSERAELIAETARCQKELQRHSIEVESYIATTCREITALANEFDASTRQLSRVFATLGVSSLWEYTELTDRLDEYDSNYEKLSSRQNSINALLSPESTSPEDLKQFEGMTPEGVQERSSLFQDDIKTINRDLQIAFETRGKLKAKLTQISSDRETNHLRLQKRELELQIQTLEKHWRVWSLTEHLFAGVRKHFETQRQPETLRNASLWLNAITDGDYCRIWTPLGEDQLYVDDSHGQHWAINSLSRGTRESIYLSLRFALVRSYHEEGISLPLILDDVLVNCDRTRAENAIKAIHQFSNEVGQVLFFTCHDHIAELFNKIGADVRPIIKPDTVPAPGIPRISFNVAPGNAENGELVARNDFAQNDIESQSIEQLHEELAETDDLITDLEKDEYGEEIDITLAPDDDDLDGESQNELLELVGELDEEDENEYWDDEEADDELAA